MIYSPDGIENSPVLTTQDIQKGAIHNSLEWNSRWKDRLKTERNFRDASSFLLDAWGELLGIKRNSEIDSEYKDYINSKIFPPDFTIAWVKSIITNAQIKETYEVGFFLNDSFLDDPIDLESTGSTLTALSNAIYIIYEKRTDIAWEEIYLLLRHRSAGIAIYIGWIERDKNEPELMYLNEAFLNDGFIGE